MAQLVINYGEGRDNFLKSAQTVLDDTPQGTLTPLEAEAIKSLMSLIDKVQNSEDGVTVELTDEESRSYRSLLLMTQLGVFNV